MEGRPEGGDAEESDVHVTPPPSQQSETVNNYETEAVGGMNLIDPYSEDPIFSSVKAMREFVRQREPSLDSIEGSGRAGRVRLLL